MSRLTPTQRMCLIDAVKQMIFRSQHNCESGLDVERSHSGSWQAAVQYRQITVDVLVVNGYLKPDIGHSLFRITPSGIDKVGRMRL